MKIILAVIGFALSALVSQALPSFDPFADATGSGGTAYNAGDALAGQTNLLTGAAWGTLNSSGTGGLTKSVIVTNDNLSYTGFPASSGRAILVNSTSTGQVGTGGRLSFGTIASGNVYFSFLMRATDISAVATTGSPSGNFWCGFNNATGSQPSSASVAPLKITMKRNGTDSTKYFLGVGKSGTTYANAGFESGNGHDTNETLLVVGRITINSGGSDDTVALWVNPSASDFGQANEGLVPTPTATCADSTVMDNLVASFMVETRASANMANVEMDEVRVGTTWASVTSVAATLPKLTWFYAPPNIVLSWPTNAAGFALESTPSLLNTNTPWAATGDSIVISNDQNTVTETLLSTNRFFRLHQTGP